MLLLQEFCKTNFLRNSSFHSRPFLLDLDLVNKVEKLTKLETILYFNNYDYKSILMKIKTHFMSFSFRTALQMSDVCLPSLSWCKIQSKLNVAAMNGKKSNNKISRYNSASILFSKALRN